MILMDENLVEIIQKLIKTDEKSKKLDQNKQNSWSKKCTKNWSKLQAKIGKIDVKTTRMDQNWHGLTKIREIFR